MAEKTNTFTKKQMLLSKRYAESKDLLNALLKDDKTYTHEQVTALIQKFLKQEAK